MDGARSFENGLARIPESVTEQCGKNVDWDRLTPPLYPETSRCDLVTWSLFAIQQSMDTAGWSELGPRDGLVVATTTGMTKVWEQELLSHFQGGPIEGHVYQPLGRFGKELRNCLQLSGPMTIVSSACSAGAQAIGVAKNWLNAGRVDRCLVLGAEQICQLTETGFRSLSLVTEEACSPFNKNFNNICLSEAAAVLCLENSSDSQKVYIDGYGCSSDAYSMTSPKPDGSGPRRAMEMALDMAHRNVKDVDWVHAHGTGSLPNDEAECSAMQALGMTAFASSTKGVHGHSLAASGVLETILCAQALLQQKLIPSWYSEPQGYDISICNSSESSKPIELVLKNSLGFGGVNASLAFSYRGVN